MRFKIKKGDKRAMGESWKNSDSSESKSEGKEIANFCLMARESIEKNGESEKVTLEYLLTFTKDCLA